MHHLPQELNEVRSIFFVKNTKDPVQISSNVDGIISRNPFLFLAFLPFLFPLSSLSSSSSFSNFLCSTIFSPPLPHATSYLLQVPCSPFYFSTFLPATLCSLLLTFISLFLFFNVNLSDVDSFMGNLIEYGVLCGSPLQMLGQSITQVHQPLLDISQNTGRVSDTLKNEFSGSIYFFTNDQANFGDGVKVYFLFHPPFFLTEDRSSQIFGANSPRITTS